MLFLASELVQRILSDPVKYQNEKKDEMNDKLNTLVPFFRCSDHDIVRVYYYLWSLYLMYYTGPGEGMRRLPTTQTAVNNFLGLHRYFHELKHIFHRRLLDIFLPGLN